jgi:hypothetical protein
MLEEIFRRFLGELKGWIFVWLLEIMLGLMLDIIFFGNFKNRGRRCIGEGM